ncbi:MAG: hypothetical protein NWF00_10905 [Candidatus Bathyarchaeota archaeon]|nr:hypothetical protein [Candidatus Bathyarchaeota archaeon]
MSLTLRDAQHLSWKTFKKFEKMWAPQAANFNSADELAKKACELAEKLKTKAPQTPADKEEFGKHLSHLLFSMFILAESQGVVLEDSFLQAVDELILGFVS